MQALLVTFTRNLSKLAFQRLWQFPISTLDAPITLKTKLRVTSRISTLSSKTSLMPFFMRKRWIYSFFFWVHLSSPLLSLGMNQLSLTTRDTSGIVKRWWHYVKRILTIKNQNNTLDKHKTGGGLLTRWKLAVRTWLFTWCPSPLSTLLANHHEFCAYPKCCFGFLLLILV